MAGERQITEGITTNSTKDNDGLVTIVDTLRYTFAASDHGQTVRCITEGSWIDVEQDDYQASVLLNVKFPPQPQDPITQYSFVEGQTGDIAVNFIHPPPTRAWWTTEDEGNIDVSTELANFSAPNQTSNYEAQPLKPVNGSQGTYEAVLRLKRITRQQDNMVYRLSLESILMGQSRLQEHTVHISVEASPLPDFNADPLPDFNKVLVVGAIVVMIALVVIVGVIVYACKSGRCCFAVSKNYTVTRRGSGVDEENPSDIVKEKECHDSNNLYKSTTTELNL